MRIYIISVLLFFAIYVTGIDSFGQMKVKILEPPSEVSSITDEILTTKLTKEEISTYIRTFIRATKPLGNVKIKQIVDNMQFEKMYIERSNPDRKVIIIPMNEVYFSQNIDLNMPKPLQYVLIFETESEGISRADFLQFYPEDKTLEKMPKNAFKDCYYDVKTQINGVYTLINFRDQFQFELTIKNGKRVKARYWESKEIVNANNLVYCKEWTLITDLLSYEGEGSIKTTKQPLGKSYTECPPGYTCDVR